MKIKCLDFYGKTHMVDKDHLIDRLSAYGVYVSGNRVLLIHDPRSLRWELPGGGIEIGESPEQGLKREIEEETGLSVTTTPKFLTQWIEYYFDATSQEAWRSLRNFYIVSDISGDFLAQGNGDDSDFAGMVNISELDKLNMVENMRNVIKMAKGSL